MGWADRRKVLVAEDDPVQRDILEEVLLGEGYEVLVAASPVELVEQLAHGPDAVLMDLVGVLSPQVMRTLLALPRRPAVLLVSGDNSLPQMAARLRADAFVRKPYELDVLLGKLDALARRGTDLLVSMGEAQL